MSRSGGVIDRCNKCGSQICMAVGSYGVYTVAYCRNCEVELAEAFLEQRARGARLRAIKVGRHTAPSPRLQAVGCLQAQALQGCRFAGLQVAGLRASRMLGCRLVAGCRLLGAGCRLQATSGAGLCFALFEAAVLWCGRYLLRRRVPRTAVDLIRRFLA
jgi:hypothetical protein